MNILLTFSRANLLSGLKPATRFAALATLLMAVLILAACGGGGGSSSSGGGGGVSSAPAMPSGLSWSAIDESTVSLMWDAAPTANNYTISRTGLQTTTTDSNYTDSGVVVNASYAYSVAACNAIGCSASINVTAEYFPIVSTFNIDDSGTDGDTGNFSNEIELAAITSITTAVVSGSTLLFSAGQDEGISVFNVTTSGSLEHLFSIADNATLLLGISNFVSTAEIAGITYLLVTSNQFEHGISVFSVAANGALTLVDSQENQFTNSNTNVFNLRGPNSTTILVINGQTYLFVGKGIGLPGDGVGIFSVSDEGTLTYVDAVEDGDDPTFQLFFTNAVATATIGSVNYLFVTASQEDAVSVFRVVEATGNLSYVGYANQTNYPNAKLNEVIGATTAIIDDTTYLFVASFNDDGVSVFSVDAAGSLINVANIDDTDDETYQLDGARSVATTKIAGTTYLFVAGFHDDGVSVFSVDAAGSLNHVASLDDAYDASYELEGAISVTTAEIAGNFYMLVAGQGDNGVSVFKLNLGGHAPAQ